MDIYAQIKRLLRSIDTYTEHSNGLKLRAYQINVALAIVDSVKKKKGLTFVVMFPRQSGKNELQAQIESYLLTIFSQLPAEIVKVSPTWKPQSLNAMRRLERTLSKSLTTRSLWHKESGYIFKVGDARIYFLSADPAANIVGATASTLLECDEAQDVLPSKWDKDVAPMAASTNATRVFWGTAWTSRTLLARELRAARQAEKRDGIQRAFVLTADDVAKEVPAYGKFVAEQIARLGRNHPMVRTQFFSEEIDAEGGLFPASRIALMQGSHPRQVVPPPRRDGETPGVYAFLLDLAGADETSPGDVEEIAASGRDSTALTIVEVDMATLTDELIQAPTYRVVDRKCWTDVKHSALYGQLRGLVDLWDPRYIVADATGIGAGVVSFLAAAFPDKVIPFTFTSKSKSDLGWSFLAVIDTGRYKEYAPKDQDYFDQVEACQSLIMDGPGKLLRWSVPDGTRHPVTGKLLHDDLLISAALCSQLDTQPWGIAQSGVIQSVDPLAALKEAY